MALFGAVTVLGTILQIVFSVLLTLVPASVLKKEQMRFSLVLCFFAIFAMSKVGELIFAVPLALFLLLYAIWVRFTGNASSGPKRVLFIITIVISTLYLLQHIVHLPIRISLHQPPVKIATNIAGIFAAAAMLITPLELRAMRNRRKENATDSLQLSSGNSGEES